MATSKLVKDLFVASDECTDSRTSALLYDAGMKLKERELMIHNMSRYHPPSKMTRKPTLEKIVEALETWDALPAWIRSSERYRRVSTTFIATCFQFTSDFMRSIQNRKSKYYKEYYGWKIEYPARARMTSSSLDEITVVGVPIPINNEWWSPAVYDGTSPQLLRTKDLEFCPPRDSSLNSIKGEMAIRQNSRLKAA